MPGPTDLEQLLLNYINDARLDPMANAARYISSYSPLTSPDAGIQSALNFFGVNGTALQSQYLALNAVAPLAWNENLAAAARTHSDAMIAADSQSHQLPGEADFVQRAQAAGYTNYSTLGENIYAYSNSPLYAHAGFMVDWGVGPNGMQSPPGHRQSIMSSAFREVGIGIRTESNPATQVGPLVITQDFGSRFSTGNFILGTAYNDTDNNNFYSVGEGLGSLVVTVGPVSTTSWASGGYTLSTGATGSQTVTFTGAGLSAPVNAVVNLTTSNLMFDVVNGNTLLTSASAAVSGPITRLVGLGINGLTLSFTDGLNHTIIGNKGNDTITGGGGKDILTGAAGDDTINGGLGVDTATYLLARSNYIITRNGLTTTVTGANSNALALDGTDTLTGVERLQFGGGQSYVLMPQARADFTGDGTSDFLWQNDSGQAAIWTIGGAAQTGGGTVGGNPGPTWHVKGSGDFNDDGKSDILWQNDDGQAVVWLMDGLNQTGGGAIGGNPGPTWHVKGSGDFDGDGKADILWQNDDGQAAVWTVNGLTQTGGAQVGGNPGASWHVIAAADFNGDGKSDILWQNDDGQAAVWLMDGLNQTGGATVGGNPGSTWHVKGAGDFDGDGKADILWQNDDGQAAVWTMDGLTQTGGATVGGNPGPTWHVIGAGDYSGDGKADILWQNDDGQAVAWTMNGLTQTGGGAIGGNPGNTWHLISS